MQRHFKRAEIWTVLKGACQLKTIHNDVTNAVLLEPLKPGYEIEKEYIDIANKRLETEVN